MIIVVEGMDNTGKTTLIKRLSEELFIQTLKSPGPLEEKEIFKWSFRQIYNSIDNKELVIYDRFAPISDQIYGNVLRGNSPFNSEEGQKIFQLTKFNSIIIACRTEVDRIFQFHKEEMDGVISNAHKLLQEYDQMFIKMQNDNWNIHYYDYTKPEDYSHIKETIEHAKRNL